MKICGTVKEETAIKDFNNLQTPPISMLHRYLQMKPGCVPQWLVGQVPTKNGSTYNHFDLVTVIIAVALIGPIWLLRSLDVVWAGFIWFAVWTTLILLIVEPFKRCEVLGRRRRIQGECAWCGHNLRQSTGICTNCGNEIPTGQLRFHGE